MTADDELRRRFGRASDDELTAQLELLGQAIAWPAADGVAPRVSRRLAGERPLRRSVLPWRGPRLPQARLRRAALLAVAALLLIAAVAVGLGLGVPGIGIHFGPLPTVSPTSSPTPAASPAVSGELGAGLELGNVVSLGAARAAVDWPLLVPALPELDAPAETWLDGTGHTAAVSMVWPGDPARPALPDSSIGLLLTQFRGYVDEEFLGKSLGPGSRLVAVTVGGEPGFWIEGAPHALSYPVSGDGRLQDRVRLAGNVLLWTRDGITVRLEIADGQADALRIADAMH